jgi:2-octaprenyl-6-methoxyphenol hydroxylase
MMTIRKTDVLISGGGMVGLTLGLACAQGGLKTLIIDTAAPATVLAPQFDGRVSALAYASVRMLRALGVWDSLSGHAQPIREILVTDGKLASATSPFSLHFDSAEVGAEALGYIAENRHIRSSLYDAVGRADNLELVAPATVKNLAMEGGSAVVTLDDGSQVACALVIAAEGRESRLRAEMGINTIGWSYPQVGIVATVEHEKPHNGVAYEHFLPSGPFAILPLPGNRSSLVWTETKMKAPALLALDEAGFNAELARRFGDHLGKTKSAGPRWSYPLAFHIARDFVKPRFALAGDTAHGIHPIAGQGLNLGLKDAAALAEVLLDAARLGRDIGALDTLKRYERWRRFDSVVMGGTMDALNRLFSNDIAPIRHLRDLGLGIVDSIAPARRFFMRHAGGDVGKLPKLMKGEAA